MEWEVHLTDDVDQWLNPLADSDRSRTHWSAPAFLLTFDPWRSAILLVAGDKSGNWSNWYRRAIPQAESMYGEYLRERALEEGER